MSEPMKDMNWDWVTARHNADPEVAFHRIHQAVEENVRVRNTLASVERGLQVEEVSGRRFDVVRYDRNHDQTVVTFELSGGTIKVYWDHNDASAVTATPVLTPSGALRLKTAQGEIEEWQMLRDALEGLLFPKGPQR